MTECTFS